MQFVKVGKAFAVVDDEDWDQVRHKNWHLLKTGYAGCNNWIDGRNYGQTMHRMIMKPRNGFVVDHIDGDKLNNRRANLRVCRHANNCKNAKLSKANKTGFKGVDLHSQNKNFRAQIMVNGKTIHLGCFKTAELAGKAYDAASLKYHGKFANKKLYVK